MLPLTMEKGIGMNKKGRRSVSQGPVVLYDGIILQVQKRGQELVLSIFTKQEGILRVFVPKRCRGKQGYGALSTFSLITFDAMAGPQGLVLREYECHSNPGMMSLTWERYVYSQIFIEMVQHVTPSHVQDIPSYELVIIYSQQIIHKNPRVLTIIAGWQLMSLAGFGPDIDHARLFVMKSYGNRPSYYIGDDMEELTVPVQEVALSYKLRDLWHALLTYPWDTQETVHFSASGLTMLENMLYSYVVQCSEKDLKTLTLLEK